MSNHRDNSTIEKEVCLYSNNLEDIDFEANLHVYIFSTTFVVSSLKVNTFFQLFFNLLILDSINTVLLKRLNFYSIL